MRWPWKRLRHDARQIPWSELELSEVLNRNHSQAYWAPSNGPVKAVATNSIKAALPVTARPARNASLHRRRPCQPDQGRRPCRRPPGRPGGAKMQPIEPSYRATRGPAKLMSAPGILRAYHPFQRGCAAHGPASLGARTCTRRASPTVIQNGHNIRGILAVNVCLGIWCSAVSRHGRQPETPRVAAHRSQRSGCCWGVAGMIDAG